MKSAIRYVLYGILMGAANVIPGVSGGTIAIILNFYDKLMNSITLDFKVIKNNLPFLVPLGIGLGAGVIGVAKLMGLALDYFPTQTYLAFIGVVVGSVPLIMYKAKKSGNIRNSSYLICVLFIALMVFMAFFKADKTSGAVKYVTLNTESFVMCFISMAIGMMSMIIPGVSGSLILMMMGMYQTIYVEVIGNFNIPLLIPSGLGAVFGFLGGAKVISYLLKNHEQSTYMAILGLLLGSILELIKNADLLNAGSLSIISGLVCMVLMFAVVYFFSDSEIKRGE